MARISTHALDTAAGRPARGLAVALFRLESGRVPLTRAVTNADGRTDEPLLSGTTITTGAYELVFDVGTYLGSAGSFLGEVPIRFLVSDPAGHYHVPLLFSAFSYTTYRGS